MLFTKKRKFILLLVIFTFGVIFYFSNMYISKEKTYPYVELGQYIGLEQEQQDIIVTKQEYQEELEYRLMKYAEVKLVKDREIEEGDLVTISLENVKDKNSRGEENKTSYEMRVGDNEINYCLDENLIGMNLNESKILNIKDTESDNETLSVGNYKIEVNKIEEFCLPKLNDEFVKNQFNANNVTEYKEVLNKEIYLIKLEMEINKIKENLLDKVIANSKITGYSTNNFNEQYLELTDSYKAYAELNNLNYNDVLKIFDTNDEKLKELVINNIYEDMIIDSIISKEKLYFSNYEYKELEMDYISQYGYKDIDDFIHDCGKRYLEREVNKNIVLDFLYKNAKIDIIK